MAIPTVERDEGIPWLPAAEIRAKFLEFFEERGHTVVPSASLVPAGDQTLLFVNSGMVPFKDVLTGVEKRDYTRAVNFQRSLRVAGKHNDFEEVGRTPRHHTLFEMLGNWSFGDYFKREAIHWAWQFLTRDLGLPPERLAATVYSTDDFAHDVWRDEIGLPPERLVRWGDFEKGDEKNWWRMADIGPCGPCSELHYDRGPHLSEGPECVPDHSEHCPRWLEVWNLVFMEFELHPDRSLTPLPAPGVDTGMGLERIASAVQQVYSNYDTDLFVPIHARMRELLGHDPDAFEAERFSYQVIADHSRAVTFIVADGITPSNEGRGYVLRRILRRGVRHGRLLGRTEPFMVETAKVVIDSMSDAYPHLAERRDEILGVIGREELQFARTLEAGMSRLEEALIPLTSNERVVGRQVRDLPAGAPILPGEVAFRLHDTYGFPFDLTVELAAEYGVRVDEAGYFDAMGQQKAQSRANTKASLSKSAVDASLYGDLLGRLGATEFVGYDTTAAEGGVLAILRDGTSYQELTALPEIELRAEAAADAELILDRTPFYAEGGGQVADTGVLRRPGGDVLFTVTDTQRTAGTQTAGLIVHRGRLHGTVRVGDTLIAEVDAERRAHTMRNHTGTHLLHRALRNVVGESARQAGSLVHPDYLRFDYPGDRTLTDDEQRAIETEVRRIIREDRPVSIEWMTMADANVAGADAFFDEKYGEKVRTIRVDGYSHELCGGTHADATGQIGGFVITGERSIGSGMRRIEALTGAGADRYVDERLARLQRAADAVGARTADQLEERIAALQDELRTTRQRLKAGASGVPKPGDVGSQVTEAQPGVRAFVLAAPFASLDDMKGFARDVQLAHGSNFVGLFREGEQPGFVFLADPVAQAHGIGAGATAARVAPLLSGKGGGRPDIAQGQGTDAAGLPNAIELVRRLLSGDTTA